jgi:hypothetical protein
MRGVAAIATIRGAGCKRCRPSMAIMAFALLTPLLAACGGQMGAAPGALPKPVQVAVGEIDAAPDTVISDPGFAARLGQRMGGLTGYTIGQETNRRAGATIRSQLAASLRAGGLPADVVDTDNARGDIAVLLITGRLRSLDEATLRQRRLAPIGPGRVRVVADIKVEHATTGFDRNPFMNFEAEDNAPPPSGRAAPMATTAAPVPGGEPLSPDIDAHLRRIANDAAARILAKAAEQGWTGAGTARAGR